jgi:ketosteroid isomerase-like protein
MRRIALLTKSVVLLAFGVVAAADDASSASASRQPAVSVAKSEPDADEAAIRAREDEERRAVLARDFDALERIWAAEFTVNAPTNKVIVGAATVLGAFRQGVVHYTSFERNIEQIRISGDHAIVMGRETVKPTGKAPLAGKTVERRFTNIWRREGGTWRAVARHANVISAQ